MRLGLYARLLIFSVILAVFPIGLAGVMLLQKTEAALKSAVNDELLQAAQGLTDEVDALFLNQWLAPLDVLRGALDDPKVDAGAKLALLGRPHAELAALNPGARLTPLGARRAPELGAWVLDLAAELARPLGGRQEKNRTPIFSSVLWPKTENMGVGYFGSPLIPLGALVEVEAGDRVQRRVYTAGVRGYQQDSRLLHFGLGLHEKADRIRVRWRKGEVRELEDVRANQHLIVSPLH